VKSTQLESTNGSRTSLLIFDTGEEVASVLLDYARSRNMTAAHFTAIGAFRSVTLGYFNWETKEYEPIPIREQVEVLSLIGDVAIDAEGQPVVHAHVVVGRNDGTAYGGHLLEAHVRPTLELVLTESPAHLQRQFLPEAGLALIRI